MLGRRLLRIPLRGVRHISSTPIPLARRRRAFADLTETVRRVQEEVEQGRSDIEPVTVASLSSPSAEVEGREVKAKPFERSPPPHVGREPLDGEAMRAAAREMEWSRIAEEAKTEVNEVVVKERVPAPFSVGGRKPAWKTEMQEARAKKEAAAAAQAAETELPEDVEEEVDPAVLAELQAQLDRAKAAKADEKAAGDFETSPEEVDEVLQAWAKAVQPEAERQFKPFTEGRLTIEDVPIEPVPAPRDAPVARLRHSLRRVPFSPGIHYLRDPRSGVWSFETDLGAIPPPEDFAFHRLPQYITASQDDELQGMATTHGTQFVGSTSTLTQALSQIYFTISGGKGVDLSPLGQDFAQEPTDFTAGAQLPAMLSVKILPNGTYAIDNDKTAQIDENVLSDYGRILEKLLTVERWDFKRFLNSAPESAVPEKERTEREAYCYSKSTNLLMRSQLDCQDARLPGNGTFDIKTRACFPIRHDRANYKVNRMYDISQTSGYSRSFEREYYDLTRSGMLKYCFQARIGQMDGIFVAYHNTSRCYGFQYLPRSELDERLFGSVEAADQVFRLTVGMLERVLKMATELYPKVPLSITINRVRPRRRGEVPEHNELKVTVQPQEDVDGERPLRAMVFRLENELDGEKVASDGVVFSEDPAVRANQKWSLNYSVHMTEETVDGLRAAHKVYDQALGLVTAMNSLYVPQGRTPADMMREDAFKRRAEKRERKEEEERVKEEKAVTEEAEAEEDSASTAPAERKPRIRWAVPNERILAIRREAIESGQEFSKRRKAWTHNRSAWWLEEDSDTPAKGNVFPTLQVAQSARVHVAKKEAKQFPKAPKTADRKERRLSRRLARKERKDKPPTKDTQSFGLKGSTKKEEK